MLFYFGVDLVDVIAGRGPAPLLVNGLVRRLPDTSLTVALVSGGRENFGWGIDRHLAADLYDALNVNTRATGQWGKGKPPNIPAWPRPTTSNNQIGRGPNSPSSSRQNESHTTGDGNGSMSVAELYRRFQHRP